MKPWSCSPQRVDLSDRHLGANYQHRAGALGSRSAATGKFPLLSWQKKDPAAGIRDCPLLELRASIPFQRSGWRDDVGKHPQNGPTFSKAPPKKPPRMSDEELAAWRARQNAELKETKRAAAAARSFSQLVRRDPKAALQEIGLGAPSSNPLVSVKRRRV
jgi:hypothetical protein